MRMTLKLAAGLTAGGAMIISGGAMGLDTQAAVACLETGGRPVSILPCGLDINYPKETEWVRERILEAGGALITEYPLGTTVLPGTFEDRNRLMSGVAHGICVVEAPSRSGTLITARHAREQGRDIFAIPGPINSLTSSGANQLIRQGAQLIGSAADVLREYTAQFGQILDLDAAQLVFDSADLTPDEIAELKEQEATQAEREKSRKKVKDIAPLPKRLKVAAPEPSLPQAAKEKPPLPETASPAAKQVYELLTDQPQPIDLLAQQAEMTIPEALAALTELEMFGCAKSHAGQQYSW